jgi:hypothetical protein
VNDPYFLTHHELETLLATAAAAGAKKALADIGLTDESATHDVHELRELLKSWKEAKKTAINTFVGWLTKGALVLMAAGLIYKIKGD